MDVLTAIRTKRAVRRFTGDPIPDDVLEQILRAALRSQSSKNTQPWQLIVVRDRATLEALSKTGDFLGHVAGAAACVLFAAPNEQGWTWFDLGQCASYLQLAAHGLGVGSCLGAIYRPDEARRLLGVPDGVALHSLVSLGFAAPEDQPARMGGRKPISEAVHWERWA
jgi:nitroreductase